MKKWIGICIIAALFLLNGPLHSSNLISVVSEEGYQEYQVKAAFIYNFLKFVEWPAEAPASSSPSINLCITGKNPFGENINIINGKPIGNKKTAVRHIGSLMEVKDCHALFIPGAEGANLSKIIESTEGLHILTIGDTDGFAQKGVIINMYIEDRKVRFEVNLNAAKRIGLRIDPRLLKLARIVGQQ